MVSVWYKIFSLFILSVYPTTMAQFADDVMSGLKGKNDKNDTEQYDYETAEYRLINPKYSSTCILLRANISIEMPLSKQEDERSRVFLPKDTNIRGDCKEPTLVLSWENNELKLKFIKTMGGERWYLDSVQLVTNKSSSERKHFEYRYGNDGLMVTPVGRSYACETRDIELKQVGKPQGAKAKVILRKLQVQPYMYKSEYFEPKFKCENEHLSHSENAQIAVGSTLAVTVIMTISGYAVYRHFKVKNVQYDSIE